MIVDPMFWMWVGVFAEVEIIMTHHSEEMASHIFTPSPLHTYIQERK